LTKILDKVDDVQPNDTDPGGWKWNMCSKMD
jgi:hypothetical protein